MYICVYMCLVKDAAAPHGNNLAQRGEEYRGYLDVSKEVSKQVEHVECVNSGAQRYHTLRLVHYIVPRNGQLHGSAVRDRPLSYVLR